MIRHLFLAGACLGTLLLAACETREEPPANVIQTDVPFTPEGTVSILSPRGDVRETIQVELAESDAERSTGLMYRRSLPARSGMLFLFPDAGERGFWMKNTPMPLDIVFIGPDERVVNIVRRTRPFSETLIESTGPAQYVLELRAGMADRLGITDSTRIRWARN